VPSLFVAVAGLPKEARIEKQTLYHTGRSNDQGDEDTSEEAIRQKNSTGMPITLLVMVSMMMFGPTRVETIGRRPSTI
jgi:hypothetical protein